LNARGGTGEIRVALLTGGSDRPYVFGLTKALIAKGVNLDLIGSDELDFPEFRGEDRVTFFNLRGSLRTDVPFTVKVKRILIYYAKLIRYAALARPRIFHILWNNKFENFDRTVLMLYYKLLRKKIALTVHNVNKLKRDNEDNLLNRLTLRFQYELSDRLFVHTDKMRADLVDQFSVRERQVAIIPFGINNSVPNTDMTSPEARLRLKLSQERKVILFFGRITPYKGIDLLITAFREILKQDSKYFLIVTGRPDRCAEYWAEVRDRISRDIPKANVLVNDRFVPDEEVEVYFKAADVLVLPYRDIYQSGVLFTGQGFGIPILAADVGSFEEDILKGKTGFLFKAGDAKDLAETIDLYFASALYKQLDVCRREIYTYAAERHSWDTVAGATVSDYNRLLTS
jgi:D-inositol-3-phosphate glycosyltransferase